MAFLDFAKRKTGLLLLGVAVASALALGFTYTKIFVFPSSGGSLSPYLVGYFDLRTINNSTHGNDCYGDACADDLVANRTDVGIELTNPTNTDLIAVISVFKANGDFIDCTNTFLGNNDTDVVFVHDDIIGFGADGTDRAVGVIKVVTFLDEDPAVPSKVQAGAKGVITHYVRQDGGGQSFIFSRQSQLQQVPVEALKAASDAELFNIARPQCLANLMP
jgi:hypothetical protein